MHLMLVNDDGIHAPGIRALCAAAKACGHRVSVCAPDQERSAASHSITLRRPLHVQRVEFPGAEVAYAVDGLPADCARLGLYLIPGVDVVLSGINNGSNLGGACVYSGTVGAATEASMSGTPAMAISQCAYNAEDYSASARLAMRALAWMADHPLPRGVIYNLNVPDLPYEQIRGVCAATLAPTYLDDPAYVDLGNGDYSYTHGVDRVTPQDPSGDVLRIREGYATMTCLSWNLRDDVAEPDVSGLRL